MWMLVLMLAAVFGVLLWFTHSRRASRASRFGRRGRRPGAGDDGLG